MNTELFTIACYLLLMMKIIDVWLCVDEYADGYREPANGIRHDFAKIYHFDDYTLSRMLLTDGYGARFRLIIIRPVDVYAFNVHEHGQRPVVNYSSAAVTMRLSSSHRRTSPGKTASACRCHFYTRANANVAVHVHVYVIAILSWVPVERLDE